MFFLKCAGGLVSQFWPSLNDMFGKSEPIGYARTPMQDQKEALSELAIAQSISTLATAYRSTRQGSVMSSGQDSDSEETGQSLLRADGSALYGDHVEQYTSRSLTRPDIVSLGSCQSRNGLKAGTFLTGCQCTLYTEHCAGLHLLSVRLVG